MDLEHHYTDWPELTKLKRDLQKQRDDQWKAFWQLVITFPIFICILTFALWVSTKYVEPRVCELTNNVFPYTCPSNNN